MSQYRLTDLHDSLASLVFMVVLESSMLFSLVLCGLVMFPEGSHTSMNIGLKHLRAKMDLQVEIVNGLTEE